MARCLLAVGSNLGDRAATLRAALKLISELPNSQLLARSRLLETAPVGGPAGQQTFLNGAILVETQLTPQEVADSLHGIEAQLGRDRKIRWDARTIDIDILLFGHEVVDEAALQIPHPRMSFRQFVLAPAAEIAGEMVHPLSGWTITALLNHWGTAPREVAIVTRDSQLAKWLVGELSRELGGLTSDLVDSPGIKLMSCETSVSPHSALVIALDATANTQGPLLQITAADHQEILHEALAAIRAAWPD